MKPWNWLAVFQPKNRCSSSMAFWMQCIGRRHRERNRKMFSYLDNSLCCENVALADIAQRAGTPCYIYSSQMILDNFRAYDEALGDLPHNVCYSVKANSSVGILALLAQAGSGFDIVSGGELFRVLKAGGGPEQ